MIRAAHFTLLGCPLAQPLPMIRRIRSVHRISTIVVLVIVAGAFSGRSIKHGKNYVLLLVEQPKSIYPLVNPSRPKPSQTRFPASSMPTASTGRRWRRQLALSQLIVASMSQFNTEQPINVEVGPAVMPSPVSTIASPGTPPLSST